ncbi:hypothetical protein CERZMDRAFT_48835, partial [Cercospora zeae-maydis SCOH1-5]
MAPAHKDRVHFFNTFFFSSLTTKNGKKDFNYDAVKKWTKNADLLSKPYIVVPINLDLHWFVAIIYNLPALRRKMIDSDDDPAAEDAVDLCSESELRIIKRYVIEEAKEKRQIAVAFEDLQGVNAKGIPQQDNFWDCGVYLIGYMKEFARDPDRFVTKILGRQIDEN